MNPKPYRIKRVTVWIQTGIVTAYSEEDALAALACELGSEKCDHVTVAKASRIHRASKEHTKSQKQGVKYDTPH